MVSLDRLEKPGEECHAQRDKVNATETRLLCQKKNMREVAQGKCIKMTHDMTR